jgi:hypothetical protein
MNVQKIKITETRGIIQFGEAIIDKIIVQFCYNLKSDKFTAISYDRFKASGIFPEGRNKDIPQSYLVGNAIKKAIKNNN